MGQTLFYKPEGHTPAAIRLLLCMLLAVAGGWLIAGQGMVPGILMMLLPFVAGFVSLVFLKPRAGYIFLIIYCFLSSTLGKHIPGPQFGLGHDGLLVLTWLAVIFHRSGRYRKRHLNNDLVWIAVAWFGITVLEIGNPERPSVAGWYFEMRSTTFYWLLSVPLGFLVFNKKSDVDLFLRIIIIFSALGALWGAKQLFFGPDSMEQLWLDMGAAKTHVLGGRLRVFSYYAEAAQFGASQGQLVVICIILACGPYKLTTRLIYGMAAALILYGMLISGTRSATFVLAGGIFVFLLLSKKIRIMIVGGIIAFSFFAMLKFTHIGSSNAQIARLRSSVDSNDPSLQVRLLNQQTLKAYLASKPFGTGVGTIGNWGLKYNADKFISTIPPDSYFVKIWAEYGIIGFTIWFGMMMYIFGKCVGIIWNLRDPALRNKMAALCSGGVGILLCSYGNEIMNQMPSSIILYVSWVFIWLSPRWDTKEPALLKKQ